MPDGDALGAPSPVPPLSYPTTGSSASPSRADSLDHYELNPAAGRYDWRIDVTAHYSGGDVSRYKTG
jgi:hypothetical protein